MMTFGETLWTRNPFTKEDRKYPAELAARTSPVTV